MAYAKLEEYDGKRTKYEGLWYQPEWRTFTSKTFSLASLRIFKGPVKLKVVKNKYYNGGENERPNYLFTIMDAKSETILELDIEDVVPVVRCRECKYAPSGADGADGFDLEWPKDKSGYDDNRCPLKCSDPWYSKKPKPDFFCAYGEKKED